MKTKFLQLIVIVALFMGTMFNLSAQTSTDITQKKIKAVVAETTRDCRTDYEKAKAIYEWIEENISYDYELYESQMYEMLLKLPPEISGTFYDLQRWLETHLPPEDEEMDMTWLMKEFQNYINTINFSDWLQKYKQYMQTMEMNMEKFNRQHMSAGMEVFKQRKGICSSIAHLYQIMCQMAGVKCDIVCGAVKSGTTVGGHAWNALELDGEMILVDIVSAISDDEPCFDVAPRTFILTHFPIYQKYQNLNHPLSVREFVENSLTELNLLDKSYSEKMKELNIWCIEYAFSEIDNH